MERVVVITGGGTGIGAACARLMAAAGETVFITGRRLALQALAEETGAVALAGDAASGDSGRLICCRRFSNARAISTF
jgi:NADP-dependent 3-hydroxy acid dehydrogenase YdfG